jgi:ATP-binding cassette subfamily A (ABC1) protein 3
VDATDGTSSPSPSQVISRITSSFTPTQQQHVRQLSDVSEISSTCPENFAGLSQCFAVVVFYDIPANGSADVVYTLQADAGLLYINVQKHTSQYEERVLPLQWAIDKVNFYRSDIILAF